ncbi:MAG: DUF1990 family protein, partial [Propionibacteriaceae bacterium]
MTDTRLASDVIDRLRGGEVTYPEVGGTRGELPAGYHHVAREVSLGVGEERFAEAAAALMSWQLQRRAGVRVLAETDTVTQDAVAVLLLGFGP